MYPHRIRLRGPWECEPVRRGDRPVPVPGPGRVLLPARWGEGGTPRFTGPVRFRRRFGRPRELDPSERVWLTFAGIEGPAEVALNGVPLGRHGGAFDLEVTSLLHDRNELIVEMEAVTEGGGIWGEVALEIRAAVFLRGVEVTRTEEGSALRVRGTVVGDWCGPLELYAILDRTNVLYAPVGAAPGGTPFDLVTESVGSTALAGHEHTLRVDLVAGASVLYRTELPVSS